MKKITSEDFMQFLGIEVGDKVKIESLEPSGDGTYTKKYEVYDVAYNDFFGFFLSSKNNKISIMNLIGPNFDIIPKHRKVGDLMCEECSCTTCQLRGIGCRNVSTNTKNTLYEILDKYFEEYPDQEIHDLLKARLDKEVEE